ncbi:hypothetical protein HMF8227_02133 [Saliniradius amylolyticus]|uniref:Metallo-beta-lactamase domain-containing protein n=1 Tax=Saliniradius amylolyticus TaxID=2183582 RepID=A0A2S2E4K9_9ALTE|nr:MBL fold metallo-hydrolase [Saliniradius amylolyticus]AWL12591.1 hypothetical protein HMF8227_02133 [Saliniradius amylolyticus]
MKLTFYGVRGSIPAPGKDFIEYGGNTACVHIELNDGTDIVLDAGTGIKRLGTHLVSKDSDIHLLLSHNHWDHIQGFPFFAPIFQSDRKIFITPGCTAFQQQDDAVLRQMNGSTFPVDHHSLPSVIQILPRINRGENRQIGSATVSTQAMNHPGSGSSYLIEADGKRLAYITDNELYPPHNKHTDFLQWVEFAKDADIIIHDAQYLQTDMPTKSGWGHSVAEETVKLAMACNAKRLALYSHDHDRTDQDIRAIEQHCHDVVKLGGAELTVFAAAEGMTIDLNRPQ